MTPWRRMEQIGDCTLYLGDCRDVMPEMGGGVDVLVTDPPYGVGIAEWDSATDTSWLDVARVVCRTMLVTPGVKHLFRWPAPTWIGCYSYPVGLKAAAGGKLNAWEPVLIYGDNLLGLDAKQFPPIPDAPVSGHPCPKPLVPFQWLVSSSTKPGETVLDPFMGSGTTGVACAKMGRRFIGIEIEETYFDIACERIRRVYAQGDLFRQPERKAEQVRMDLAPIPDRSAIACSGGQDCRGCSTATTAPTTSAGRGGRR